MSNKPIFVATHPRSCSTAFERVFMTRPDLQCIHEPFGDAFYYGPERLGLRYENDEAARIKSGFSESTYQTILDRIEREGAEGKRLFIKDIAYYFSPPNREPSSIAPSLARKERGIGTLDGNTEVGNPTVIPKMVWEKFHFTFLIRHPRSSIPSFYRCTVPDLDKVTGWYEFLPSEAGYDELRRFFDYLRATNQIGVPTASHAINGNGSKGQDTANGMANGLVETVDTCVIDADDLLENPAGVFKAYCESVGLEYSDKMLEWGSDEDHQKAEDAFAKWRGFHDDAINSAGLTARPHKQPKTEQEEDDEWTKKYGVKGAKTIRETVNANIADYEYLKQFALKV